MGSNPMFFDFSSLVLAFFGISEIGHPEATVYLGNPVASGF